MTIIASPIKEYLLIKVYVLITNMFASEDFYGFLVLKSGAQDWKAKIWIIQRNLEGW